MKKIDGEALKKFHTFHKRAPRKVTHVDIPMPKTLVHLGSGVAIEYRSTKKFSGSKRLSNSFRHIFGRGVEIYADPKGRCLFITGGRFKVTDWMRN